MKAESLLILALSLLFLVSCKKENPEINCGKRAYYYFEQSTPVTVTKECITVCFYPQISETQKQMIISGYPFAGELIYSVNTPDLNASVFKLAGSKSCDEVKEIINLLKVNPAISMATQLLRYEENPTYQGITNRFVIQLKTSTSMQQINELMLATNTSLIGQSPFDSTVYYLNADKESKADALDMANQFYETGLFQFAEPDFLLLNIGDSPFIQ
ncbi:MAG: hypothetical protein POELPBGB_03862 [Bacteroidia bacterium]|nr:hypothetical protein [Bacteroidia bacterium]